MHSFSDWKSSPTYSFHLEVIFPFLLWGFLLLILCIISQRYWWEYSFSNGNQCFRLCNCRNFEPSWKYCCLSFLYIPSEQLCFSVEKEVHAIVEAINHWKHLLLGRQTFYAFSIQLWHSLQTQKRKCCAFLTQKHDSTLCHFGITRLHHFFPFCEPAIFIWNMHAIIIIYKKIYADIIKMIQLDLLKQLSNLRDFI